MRPPQRLHAASSRTGRGSLGLWGGSRVMATMATMATPKLNLEKKGRGGGGGVITHQRIPSMRFFFRGWPAGVAMVAMVATRQKSRKCGSSLPSDCNQNSQQEQL